MSLRFREYRGNEITAIVPDLARLRIAVFRDWPYLYDGDDAYERRYLQGYSAPGGFVIGAIEGNMLVGAATAMPLQAHEVDLVAVLAANGLPPRSSLYCAEAVMLPDHRGQGAYARFFQAREDEGRAQGMTHAVFCAVQRPDDHSARPSGYRPLDGFWRARGYVPLDGAMACMSWRDRGEAAQTEKPMQLWAKAL